MFFSKGRTMGSSRRSGYESMSVGYLLIAFAISLLVAWLASDWILIVPIFLLEAGVFYIVLGLISSQREPGARKASSTIYYMFWGGTMAILGALWLISREYPGNGVLLVAMFIIWMGVVAILLSLPRFRQKRT